MRRGAHGLARPRRDPWSIVLGILLVLVTGVVLGTQYVQPNKRVIPVLVAIVVFGIAWRLDMITGLGLLTLVLPYPKGTVFGNTNLVLVLFLLVIWLLRITMRQSPPLARSPVDIPIVGLLVAYIVSFYNIEDPSTLPLAFGNTQLMVAGMLLFYLVVSNVRDERALLRLHTFQLVSLVSICLIALYELGHPGGALVPGWIVFSEVGEDFLRQNVRVGGPFFDYELLAEFCALSLLLVLLFLVRARSVTRRWIVAGVMMLVVFVMFATVTRGAFVSLAFSGLYLGWIMRRRIRFVPLMTVLVSIVGGFLLMNFIVSTFTYSGNLLTRFSGTQFKGLVPDTRTQVWKMGWDRFMESPILGHGPWYAHQVGLQTFLWPHNGYLYVANLVGVVGLSFFLWIIFRLWFLSRPRVDQLTHPSYAESYLMIANAQLTLFIIDQMKIDFLRNNIYQFQVWLMLASIAAALGVVRRNRSARPEAAALDAPRAA